MKKIITIVIFLYAIIGLNVNAQKNNETTNDKNNKNDSIHKPKKDSITADSFQIKGVLYNNIKITSKHKKDSIAADSFQIKGVLYNNHYYPTKFQNQQSTSLFI